MELYKKIKALRQSKGLTQEFIAYKLGISKNGYGKLERGENNFSLDKLSKICKILDTEIDYLLDNEGELSAKNKIEEIEKLKLIIVHKDEIIEFQNTQIQILNSFIKSLQNN